MVQENVALIGYGYWGKKLYKYLKESKCFSLFYVYFPSLQHYDISFIHREYGHEFVASIEKIWENKLVSNVVIATPINTHYAVAREALRHSKNVLVEKPLATKLNDAIDLAETARKRNLILMTEYTYTFSHALQLARQLVKEDAIGSIKSVYITFKQLGRFLAYDVFDLLGTHALSILDLFFPLDKFSFYFRPVMRTGGLVTGGLIHFDSKEYECAGYIDVNLHCPVREKKVIIYGEKGTIIYNPDSKDTLTLTLYTRTASHKREDVVKENKTFYFDENHNIRNALQAFHEAIKTRRGDNAKRAIVIASVLEQLRNSLKNKAWCGHD